jgi:hypothetical protein
MDMPPQVPMDFLRKLSGAKKLMDKVESGDYETGHVDARALTEDGVQGMMAEGVAPRRMQQTQTPTVNEITPERIAASKMPDAIKKAMLENPIPQVTMGHTFTLEDVAQFAKDEKPLPLPKANAFKKPNQMVSEQSIHNMVGLTEAEVRVIVKDEMIEFLTKYFTKSLTEDVQNKVIKQLLEAGKIRVKK